MIGNTLSQKDVVIFETVFYEGRNSNLKKENIGIVI